MPENLSPTGNHNNPLEMPFLHHLKELRTRIFAIVIGIIVGAGISYLWIDDIFFILKTPFKEKFSGAKLIGISPAEAFIVKIKVLLYAGVIISAPHTFFQIWKFIAPGLLPKEKFYAVPFVIFSCLFFLFGVWFCFSQVLPVAFNFFASEYLSIEAEPTIRLGEYLGFVCKMLLIFGVLFELPIIAFFLGSLNLIKSSWLIRNTRYAILIIFVLAAVLTPTPDAMTQLMLALPLTVLYGLCILILLGIENYKKA